MTLHYYGNSEHWVVTFWKIFCPCSDMGHKSPLQESTFSFRAQNFFKLQDSTDLFQSSYKLYFSDFRVALTKIENPEDKNAILFEITPMSRLIDSNLNTFVVDEKDSLEFSQQKTKSSGINELAEDAIYQNTKFYLRSEFCFQT